MSIFVIGLNHKTADVALREQIYFSAEKLPLYLQDLLSRRLVHEVVLLSTCNRSELYCDTNNIHAVKAWLIAQATQGNHSNTTADRFANAFYTYEGERAVAHIMTVACGLDSMILGEPQILGQLKAAYSESCAVGATKTAFHRLFQHIFSVAKEIRTSTAIGACPVSVASAALHFAQQKCISLSTANVALVGAGDTAALLIKYLSASVQKPLLVVNRNLDNARALLGEKGGYVYGFDDLSKALTLADIVFTVTGSPIPVIQADMIAQVIAGRTHRPLTFIDIAVPRDVEPSVATLSNVNVFCIDDLKAIIEINRRGREHAAEKACEMIRRKSKEFMEEIKLHANVTHTIQRYRGQVEDLCQIELQKAKLLLHQGMDPHDVLEIFATAFTKKLLHTPSVQLRQAGTQGRADMLQFAKQFFAIPDPETECI